MCPKNDKLVSNKKHFTWIQFLNINPNSLKHKAPAILASCYLFNLSSHHYLVVILSSYNGVSCFFESLDMLPSHGFYPCFLFLKVLPQGAALGLLWECYVNLLHFSLSLYLSPVLLYFIAYITIWHAVWFAYIHFIMLMRMKHKDKNFVSFVHWWYIYLWRQEQCLAIVEAQ